MTAESIARGLKARRSGSNWMAFCPLHEADGRGHNPSLGITERDGRVLVRCYGGCDQRAVIQALRDRGLWKTTMKVSESPSRRIVAEYNYTDERGALLYQVVRYDPKDFRQRRPDGRGGWIWKKGERQVLYHLPEVLEAAIVFTVEGEKDVEALRSYGFTATTSAGGAKAPWLPSYTEALRGREVIIVPDADVPGRQRAVTIARALLGKVARLIVWEPEGAKDISDWFARGHSELELIGQIEGEAVNR
jgi:hypothetical protein